MTQQSSHKPVFPREIAPYIDAGCYLLDARAPASTLYLDRSLLGKELMILNRADQADPRETKRWSAWLKDQGYRCISVDSVGGQGMDQVLDYLAVLLKKKSAMAERMGITSSTLRIVALGVPNVGKSTFLNRMIGRKRFRTGNKPGITRGPQWVRVFEDVEVLDTPGVLRSPESLNRRKPYWLLLNLMPYDFKLREEAVTLLIQKLPQRAWVKLCRYYKLPDELHAAHSPQAELEDDGQPWAERKALDVSPELADGLVEATVETFVTAGAEGEELPPRPNWLELLGYVASRQGFRMAGDDAVDRAARRLISDFQEGRFGRVTLERAGVAVVTSPVFGKHRD